MRTTTLSALGLVAVLSAPAAAAGTPGPFPGVVRQGQTNAHAYTNNPANQPCIQMMTTYSVMLTYTPPTDVLTLGVGTAQVTGRNGVAQLTRSASWCTAFTVTVTGTSVESAAAYVVNVTRATPGGGTR